MALAEDFEDYAEDRPSADRRSFYAGALSALTAKNATRDELMAEIVQFGRTIGTEVEQAQPPDR